MNPVEAAASASRKRSSRCAPVTPTRVWPRWLFGIALSACTPSYPEGHIRCDGDDECPSNFQCLPEPESDEHFCYRRRAGITGAQARAGASAAYEDGRAGAGGRGADEKESGDDGTSSMSDAGSGGRTPTAAGAAGTAGRRPPRAGAAGESDAAAGRAGTTAGAPANTGGKGADAGRGVAAPSGDKAGAGGEATGAGRGGAAHGGAGATAGSAGDAAAGSGPGCGDTRSDPLHCGDCDLICGAPPHASPICRNSICDSTCDPGYGDCDAKPDNGCETELAGDLAHCGACRSTCTAPGESLAACEASSCYAYASSLGMASPASTDPPHGSFGGVVYDQLCPSGEVLVGLDVVTDDSIAYGFNVYCARVTLAGTAAAPVFKLGEAHAPHALVGGIITPLPPTRHYACPPDTMITAVAGWLYRYQGSAPPSIRSISVSCSDVLVDAEHRLTFSPHTVLTAGDDSGSGATSMYSDVCRGPGQVVVGFKGYAGAYIDGLQTYCATLAIERRDGTRAIASP